jgi:L,D-transpeptidase catalytic domain/Putative peptidoglycan binding domain
VRKVALAALFVLGFAAAGGLSATVVASTVATETTSTVTTTVPTTTVVPPPPPPPKPKPRPSVIAPRVHIGRVAVGGLTPTRARLAVSHEFTRPLVVVVGSSWFRVRPWKLGARAYIKTAVARATSAKAGATIPLTVTVHGATLRAWAARLRAHWERKPVDARLTFVNLAPRITPDRPGRTLDSRAALPRIVRALTTGMRSAIRFTLTTVPARVSASSFGASIVIHRGSNRLYLYEGERLWRTFGVATGQASYPTPLGLFSIAVMWRDPWWYPPASPWAQGAKPIPPGPGNPLGTRWMGLTAPGVGIHGTPDPASIGYSASHGCIRMLIPEAEWLFNHVSIGTPVDIVSA